MNKMDICSYKNFGFSFLEHVQCSVYKIFTFCAIYCKIITTDYWKCVDISNLFMMFEGMISPTLSRIQTKSVPHASFCILVL